MQRKIIGSLLLTLALSGCVKSNLDNVFDPTQVLGMIIGLKLSSGSGSSTDSSTISSSVCATVPVVVDFNTAGVSSYTIPSTAGSVKITVIGAGGAGGPGSAVATCSTVVTDGGSSSVRIQGAGSDLLAATGGTAGTCGASGTQGTGGAGGTPAGVTGADGTFNDGTQAAGGTGTSNFGSGGPGYPSQTAGFTYWGGGGGGSGGFTEATYTNLAGQTLDITVGAKGTAPDSFPNSGVLYHGDGDDGYVRLLIY